MAASNCRAAARPANRSLPVSRKLDGGVHIVADRGRVRETRTSRRTKTGGIAATAIFHGWPGLLKDREMAWMG
jgi:hypothetical protein